jgi:hypothetical protein
MNNVRPPLRLIGYWWSADEPDWPHPNDCVDEAWDAEERSLVADYLESGMHAPYAFAGHSECRICKRANGNLELTDGTYLWPDGLAHYVRDHSVRLPEQVIKRALEWLSAETWDVDASWWKQQTRGSSPNNGVAHLRMPPPA